MASTIEKEVERIKQEVYKGKYTESMDDLKKILETEDISTEDKVRILNLQSKICFYFGLTTITTEQSKTALGIAKEAYELSLKINNLALFFNATMFLRWSYYKLSMYKEAFEVLPDLDTIFEELLIEDPEEAKILEPRYLIYQGLKYTVRSFIGDPVPENYIEESIKFTEKALKLAEERNEPFARFSAINNLVIFYFRTGKMEEYYNHILKFLEFQEELGNKYGIAQAYGMLGNYHYRREEYQEYLNYLTRRLRIWEEVGYELGISVHNFELGSYYTSQRNYDKALECFEEVLNYFAEKKDVFRIAHSNHNIGYIYKLKGDLHKALEFTEKAHEFYYEKKFESWWDILPSLAEIYLLIGDFDKALQYEEECLNLHKKTEYSLEIASSLSRICKIYWQKGLQDQAIETAQESLDFFKKTGNDLWIGTVLSELIFFLVEQLEIDSAKEFLKELELVNAKIKVRTLTQKINFSEAILLSKSAKERDRMRSTLLLENLLREELDYAFHVKILLSLSELLIKELQQTGDREILNKLQKHILDLYSLASTNDSFLLTAEILLLQSKLALVELDIDKAESLLNKASKIADEKKLDRLKATIDLERDIFLEEKKEIEKFDKEDSLESIVETVDFDNRLKSVKKTSLSVKQTGEQIMLKSLF